MPVSEPSERDVAARTTRVARGVWPDAVVDRVRRLPGGVSSLTYAARIRSAATEREVVVKLAPPGLPPVRNRDVLRQARVLDALAGRAGFPVPAVLLRDGGDPPDVPPMFAMELRPGQSYEPLLDVSPAPPSAIEVVAREHALTRALARLHALSPAELGLADEPVVSAGEELQRWQRLLATVDDDLAPGHRDLAARLAGRVPETVAPRLVHGDYRAANALFVGPRLEAVIDWEIWSVGDPRPDLAWVLMHTAPAHAFHPHRPAADVAAGRVVPRAQDLLGGYVAARAELGASAAELAAVTAELSWFLAVAHYKVAATLAVLWKRERRRAAPDPALAHAAAGLAAVLDAGHRALDR